jgi:hypothetical protein
MLQQLLDRPAAAADGGGSAADRMMAVAARKQLVEGATLVVQEREEAGLRKLEEVSSLPAANTTGGTASAISELSSMAMVARGAVAAKNGQGERAQEEYSR